MKTTIRWDQLKEDARWSISYVELTNLVMTNCNDSTTGTIVAWINTTPVDSYNPSEYTVSTNQVVVNQDWYYKIGWSMYFTSWTRRVSVWVDILINGVAQIWISASAFIFWVSNVEEASTTIKDRSLQLNSWDVIQFRMYQLGRTWTATAPADNSIFTIHRTK